MFFQFYNKAHGISCSLLCTGLSSRFGSPKAVSAYARRSCDQSLVARILLKSTVDEIMIVTGAERKYNKTLSISIKP